MTGDTTQCSLHDYADDGRFPNSAHPLLLYKGAIAGTVTPEDIERMFTANRWPAAWRYTVYDYHHYHSTTHEALGVASGTARLTFGGPEGETVSVEPGDVVVIPAGVAHKREEASDDFMVVGAYPADAPDRDMLTGKPGEREQALANIPKVPRPQTDPVGGADGPLTKAWAPLAP